MRWLLVVGAVAVMPLNAQARAAAQGPEPPLPVFAPFEGRQGRCEERASFRRGLGNRAWIYSLEGKPWRSFMVRRDSSRHVIALDAWYVISATRRRGGQLVQAAWSPTGQLRAGVRWLDTTAPLSRQPANRKGLTSAERDSAWTLATAVLAKCAQ